jgi:dedicator of cytokinesis protein 4
MLNEFPHAIAMQHANQPDETIFQAEAQCIHPWRGWVAVRSHGLLATENCPASLFSCWSLFNSHVLAFPHSDHFNFSLAPSEQNLNVLFIITMSVEKKSPKDFIKEFFPFKLKLHCISTLLLKPVF